MNAPSITQYTLPALTLTKTNTPFISTHTNSGTFPPPYSSRTYTSDSSTVIPPPAENGWTPEANTRHLLSLAISHALSGATASAYKGAVRKFLQFCDSQMIPSHLRWPANEFVLCAFAASFTTKRAGSTVRSYLAGIKAWHALHHLEWQGSQRLTYVVNGVAALAPSKSKRPVRPPVTRHMIIVLSNQLDLKTPFDAAVFAAACTAFWGQCRLGEILPPSASTFSPSKLPIMSAVSFQKNTASIELPWTKVTKNRGDTVVLTEQLTPTNPLSALENHFAVNGVQPHTHLFAYRFQGHHRALTKNAFLKRCNLIWCSAGYPRTTGHSFRIGGTTELLVAGVHPDVVKAMGRWSSDAFLVYWRTLNELAPAHACNLPLR
jgi:hypothetical protein